MALFLTRVELHDATHAHYANLHEGMKKSGFSRLITGDNTTTYHLPLAEYSYSGTESAATVMNVAKNVANLTGCSNAVITAECNSLSWNGLKLA